MTRRPLKHAKTLRLGRQPISHLKKGTPLGALADCCNFSKRLLLCPAKRYGLSNLEKILNYNVIRAAGPPQFIFIIRSWKLNLPEADKCLLAFGELAVHPYGIFLSLPSSVICPPLEGVKGEVILFDVGR